MASIRGLSTSYALASLLLTETLACAFREAARVPGTDSPGTAGWPKKNLRPALSPQNRNTDGVVMMTCQKQSLPVQFLKFGVDGHGVIVPQLRQDKVSLLRLDLLVRQVSLRWRGLHRAR